MSRTEVVDICVKESRRQEKSKILYIAKQIMIEVGLVSEDIVDYEAKRGILWAGRTRVAEWSTSSAQLVWNNDGLKQAGLDVEGKFLEDAIKEKLQRE